MADAHCPLGKWQQDWTIVIANPTRHNIRVAHSLSSVLVVGSIPAWYIGRSLLLPPRYHNLYSDRLRWLQKTIDDPLTSENFLWVEIDLPALPFQDLRVPRYSSCPTSPLNEALGATKNYETYWPCVFNKGKLQVVLDTYKSPYHAATLYYHHFPTPDTPALPFPREGMAYCELEI